MRNYRSSYDTYISSYQTLFGDAAIANPPLCGSTGLNGAKTPL